MPITFNPKEAIAFIAKSIVIAATVAEGTPLSTAEFYGGLLEGSIKGFSYKPTAMSIYQQLNATIQIAVENLLQAPGYEIPLDCITPLMCIFSPENALHYLKSSDPIFEIKTAIISACQQSQECDISTLPLDQIAEEMLTHVYNVIINNHELTGLISLVKTLEINRKIDTLISLVTSSLFPTHTASSQHSSVHPSEASIQSAKKFAEGFQSLLFDEAERQDPLRLCDVYVDPCLSAQNNTFENFEIAFAAYPNENVFLIEGDAGSGKSSLLIHLANQYLKEAVFQNEIVFFVKGKDIRHSKGDPIEDILQALGLSKVDELDDSIIFLDAYDEISYAARSSEDNQEYLSRLLYGCEGFTLIITVRDNYIKTFPGLRLHLKGFSPDHRAQFLSQYNSKRLPENRLMDDYITSLTKDDSEYEDDIYEVLSIPMLLYMIAVRSIDISQISEKFDLYELVFGSKDSAAIHTRGNENKRISSLIWENSYNLALSISDSMFFRNDPFISEASIISHIEDMNLVKSTKDILKNRFGIEIYLSGSNSVYTFVHRSIYEYFTAKSICRKIEKIVQQYSYGQMELSQAVTALNETFPADYYDESIFYYVMFAINKGAVVNLLEDDIIRRNTETLFHKLLASQLCTSGKTDIPYLVRLKNMLLWVFNTFSVAFGMLEIDGNTHWVKIDHSTLKYILRIKEPDDTLFISHCDLQGIFLYKYDLGSVYFIDNNLNGAVFKEANCTQITSAGQLFINANFRSADFWNANLSGFIFRYCDLRFADLRNVTLCDANFQGADLRNAYFEGADLSGTNFDRAHIYLEDFENAYFEEGIFDNAIIHNPEDDDPNCDILNLET